MRRKLFISFFKRQIVLLVALLGCSLVSSAQLAVAVDESCNRHFESAIKVVVDTSVMHLFSINAEGDKVLFSRGNLQYNPSGDQWRFALRQFDRVGNGKAANPPSGAAFSSNNYGVTTVFYDSIDYSTPDPTTKSGFREFHGVPCNNLLKSKYYGGWIDAFAWGTSGHGKRAGDKYAVHFYPYNVSDATVDATYNAYGYGPSWNGGQGASALSNDIDTNSGSNCWFDWGYGNYIREYIGSTFDERGDLLKVKEITTYRRGVWRTLTADEWRYLLITRKVDGEDSAFSYVRVRYGNYATDTVTGVLIYPDDFHFGKTGISFLPFAAPTVTEIDMQTWSNLEEEGCVFLPCGSSATVDKYWSSSANSAALAYSACLYGAEIMAATNRFEALLVRLVQDYHWMPALHGLVRKDTIDTVDCGDSYAWDLGYETRTVNQTELEGDYYDTIRSLVFDRDSIISHLHLVLATLRKDTLDTIECGDVYRWDMGYKTQEVRQTAATGEYFDTLRSVVGCDSVISHLTLVISALHKDTIDSIYCGDSYVWDLDYRTETIYQSEPEKDYYDTLRSVGGCDSIISHLQLNIVSLKKEKDDVTSCGMVYAWNLGYRTVNIQQTELEKDYYDTLRSVNGCDSVISHLHLTIPGLDVEFKHDYDATSCDAVYVWELDHRSINIKQTEPEQDYYDTVRSVGGCDSVIHHLHLTVPNVNVEEKEYDDVTSCNTVYAWKLDHKTIDIKQTEPEKDYYDTIRSVGGCDSIIYHLHLTIPNVDVEVKDSYDETSCDAVYAWTLDHKTIDIKQTEPEKDYYDTIRSVGGCDSVIYHLHLTVPDVFLKVEKYYANADCDATYEWILKHKTINIKQTEPDKDYYDTIRSVGGCDSVIYHLHLTVPGLNVITKDTVDTLRCAAETYQWKLGYKTKPITQTEKSKDYYDTIRSAGGCDSIISHLKLDIVPYEIIRRDTIDSIPCGATSYEWNINYGTVSHKRTITQTSATGTHYDTLKSQYGCDSIYAKLVLTQQTVTPSTKDYTYTLPCGVKSYEWDINYGTVTRKRTVTQTSATGTHYDTLKSQYGCDSIYAKLVLTQQTVTPTTKDYTYTLPCGVKSYEWNINYGTVSRKRTITQAGTHYDTLKTKYGCDSIYAKLVLSQQTVTPSTKDYTGRILCGLTSYEWNINYGTVTRQRTLTKAGTYYDTLKTQYGCDSIYAKLVLSQQTVTTSTKNYTYTLPCGVKSYEWNINYGTVTRKRTLTKTGTYYDTLKTKYGCDSIYAKLVLSQQTVTTSTKNYTYTLPCGLKSYEWNINYGTVTRKRTLTKAGTYYDTLKTKYGCDSIYAKLVLTKQTVTPKTNPYSATVEVSTTYSWNMGYKTKSIKASSTAGTYTYRDTLRTKYGCDSIYSVLTLKVVKKESGDFSVSSTKKVKISLGNLQYQASTKKWRFAPTQYDRRMGDNLNISSTYSGWIDLFGWGTGDNPIKTSTNNSDYATFTDWGTNVIGSDPANTWRTPTKDEWVYLLETRKVNGGAGYSFVRLKYGNNATDTVTGVVIYPDDFTFAKAGVSAIAVGNGNFTQINADTWNKLEQAGCVFLPGCGSRGFSYGQPYINEADYGLYAYYRSATPNSASDAYSTYFNFRGGSIYAASNYYRYNGYSVRLIRDL